MKKVICSFCGTTFSSAEGKCPLCGYTANVEAKTKMEPLSLDENIPFLNGLDTLGKKSKMIFDYDEVNPENDYDASVDNETEDYDAYKDYAEDDEIEDDEDEFESNAFLVVLCVIIIAMLLLATGFLFIRFLLPNFVKTEEPTVTTSEATIYTSEESTIPTVPCKMLAMISDYPKLNREGQPWLLHVTVSPVDTTDELIYTSENENIATVSENGKIVAVGEGETAIIIQCGSQTIRCPVLVDYSLKIENTAEDGVPAVGVKDSAESYNPTVDSTESTDPSEKSEEVTKETIADDNALKLKESDISLSRVRGITYELTLDCALTADQIEWVTLDSNVVLVKDGIITVMGYGTTKIIAKYNGQSVQCVVRCII